MARSSVVLGTAPPLSALRRFDVTGGVPPAETPDTTLEIYDGAETSLPQSDAIVEWIGIHCSLKQPVISAYQLNKDVSKATALSQQELGRKDRPQSAREELLEGLSVGLREAILQMHRLPVQFPHSQTV